MERNIVMANKEIYMKKLIAALRWLRAFLNSYFFYAFEFLLAVFFIYIRQEVYGVLIFTALISFILLVCDDVMATTLPFLLVCAIATNCYNSFDTFIKYAIYAPVVIGSIIFHFVNYRKPYSAGDSLSGLFAVSLALCCGGIGRYSVVEYAKGSYYVLGLGVGMIVAYFLMKSAFTQKRAYDFKERFSVIMLLWAIFCMVIMVLGNYYKKKYGIFYMGVFRLAFSPNNIATFLMLAMPFPLYLSKKNPLWALCTPFILYELYYTGSRGGILFGAVEFCVCAVYWVYLGNRKIRGGILGALALLGVVFLVVHWNSVWDKVDSFLLFSQYKKEVRYIMFLEALENFRESPIWGTGILDDSIAYGKVNVKGTMTWYHMMTAQIIGSMGMIGILAYTYQFLGRVELIFTKKSAWSLCLGISYLGVFLMSQVNPGEFCPIPFELLTVLLFIFQEQRLERAPLHIQQLSKDRL